MTTNLLVRCFGKIITLVVGCYQGKVAIRKARTNNRNTHGRRRESRVGPAVVVFIKEENVLSKEASAGVLIILLGIRIH